MGGLTLTSSAGISTTIPRTPIIGGREQPLTPCPVPSILPKKIAAAFAEADSLAERAAVRAGEAYDLERALPGIRADEAQANADAARAGGELADSKVPKIEAEVAALRAEADALRQASRDALADAIGLLAAEADSIEQKSDAAVADATRAALDVADTLARSLDELAALIAARRWAVYVADGDHPPRPRVVFATKGLDRSNGTPYPLGEILAAVRATIADMIPADS